MGRIWTSHYKILDCEDGDTGFANDMYVHYKYVNKDVIDVLSFDSSYDSTQILIHLTASSSDQKVIALKYMPSTFDRYVEKVAVYRAISLDGSDFVNDTAKYYYIGEIEGGDEGIFIDDNIEGGALLGTTGGEEINYESGLRWSEPGQPSHLKAENFMEFRSGDGDQCTGLQSQYGNLVIFKENSIHRAAVQGADPPISRVDEITPEIGCIAPNTLINIDNVLFFLSWKGFMRYDNNRLQKIDAPFDEELQFILTHTDKEYLRDASCAYNPAYNEVYLNIPMLPTGDNSGRQFYYGRKEMYESLFQLEAGGTEYEKHKRTLMGHIYVVNLDKGYSTKFGYQATVDDPDSSLHYSNEIASVRELIRMYYTNSLGELRSGDILPHLYYANKNTVAGTDPIAFKWAGIYIETPYLSLKPKVVTTYNGSTWDARIQTEEEWEEFRLIDMDEILDGAAAVGVNTGESFPPSSFTPIVSSFKSKFFTGNSETVIKRVRKALINMFSRGKINVTAITLEHDTDDDRIENISSNLLLAQQSFEFNPTVNYWQPIAPNSLQGTKVNIIELVPRSPFDTDEDYWLDDYGKPIRFSLEIASKFRTQINSLSIHWRGIHRYLS